MIIDFATGEHRHADWVGLGWRSFAIAQKFACVATGAIGTGKVFTKTTGLELHIAGAFIALDDRAVIAFDAELALLNFKTGAIGIVTADMELASGIDEVAFHRRATNRTAMLCT